MKFFSKICFLSILATLTLVSITKEANASYICSVSLRPTDTVSTDPFIDMGTHGYIVITTSSSGTPDCPYTATPSYFYICSTGASNANYCPTDSKYYRTKSHLTLLFKSLHDSLATRQNVGLYYQYLGNVGGVTTVDFIYTP